MSEFKSGTPKKRGEYLCYQPGKDVGARFAVLVWTGTRWGSLFAVEFWADIPKLPTRSDEGNL